MIFLLFRSRLALTQYRLLFCRCKWKSSRTDLGWKCNKRGLQKIDREGIIGSGKIGGIYVSKT